MHDMQHVVITEEGLTLTNFITNTHLLKAVGLWLNRHLIPTIQDQ